MRSMRYPAEARTIQRPAHGRLTICGYIRSRIAQCDVRGEASPVADDDTGSRRFRSFLVSALSSCALLLSSSPLSFAAADSLTIRFPASRNPEIRSAQELLVQAWGYVRELYYDPTFNNQDWKQQLQDRLEATFSARSRDEALVQVDGLLATLGDPFTRVLLPGGDSEYLQAITQAKIVSTGLVVGSAREIDEPLRVAYVVPGSPAARAGLLEGDKLVAVNGRSVLRGPVDPSVMEELQQDKEVHLKILRRTTEPASSSSAGGRDRTRLTSSVSAAGASVQAATSAVIPTTTTTTSPAATPSPSGATPSRTPEEPQTDVAWVQRTFTDPDGEALAATSANGETAHTAAAGEDNPTGVSGTPSPPTAALPGAPSTSYILPRRFFDVHLQPEPVAFLPVQYAVLMSPGGGASKGVGLGAGGGGGGGGAAAAAAGSSGSAAAAAVSPAAPVAPAASRVGYIRIVVFTDNVAAEVEAAIRVLKAAGCGSWLLDVRHNPGGIVGEGLAVAELLLRPGDVFAVVQDRTGREQLERVSESARALVDGQPLALLVDRYSASTSELLAGALHDNARALLFGERTYGKGRSQRVLDLKDGATLMVSVERFATPARRSVDRVGLPPDVTCRPGPAPPPVPRSAAVSAPSEAGAGAGAGLGGIGGLVGVRDGEAREEGEGQMAREQVGGLLQDPCVRVAVGKLSRGAVPVRGGA